MDISASEARRSLTSLIAKANEDGETIRIQAPQGRAVLVAEDKYDSLVETSYLLSAPANAQRLVDSYNRALSGTREGHDIHLD